jgi:uncharacterized protein YndB with AHSA1/START domain
MTLTDAIERTLDFNAPQERVWAAIATAPGICSWFCEKIIGDWSPGHTVEMVWGEFHNKATVVSSDPMSLFVYKWVPGTPDHTLTYEDANKTSVEFHLAPTVTGTRLRLVESGFSKLPADHFARCFKDNSDGWDEELAKLVALFA